MRGVASTWMNGTEREVDKVRMRCVLPLPDGPMRIMFDLSMRGGGDSDLFDLGLAGEDTLSSIFTGSGALRGEGIDEDWIASFFSPGRSDMKKSDDNVEEDRAVRGISMGYTLLSA